MLSLPPPRASVPIEHVLQLASDLKSHLLATCTSMRAAAGPEPSSKKAKGQERKKGKGAGGKRRKQSEPRGDDAEGGEGEGDEEEEVEEEPETHESWTDVLAGLTQVSSDLTEVLQD